MRQVADALELALLGITACPASGPLSNASTASAFLPGSSVSPVDLGPDLWALARKSPNNECAVLCVHNVSDRPVTFDPTRYLSIGHSDQTGLLFLSGAARSDGSLTAPTVQVPAHSFVWLGRFSTGAHHPDSKGKSS